ncbi:helix-turn-helix domain-containing protein [Aquamicrobium lusatiense]|uniref:helix-turn-helix domain-containing protein n=1 Tax=Aquamicrobium lusatiense TaxID=89772 RepID=UPI003CC80847
MSRATVYTPAMLAERWACSESHVRNLIAQGRLPAFRLGGKLIRIRASDVESYECQTGESPDCAENTALHGMKETSGVVIALGQTTPRKRPAAPRLDTRN